MTFKEILTLNKEGSFPDQKRIRKRVFRKRFFVARLMVIGISVLSLLAVAGIAFMISNLPKSKKEIIVEGSVNIIDSVVANDRSDLGMKVTSKLNITTTEDVSADELKARIAISPERDFKIKRTGNCKYRLEVLEDWKENTLYNVLAVYNESVAYRWAFQTENKFTVTNAYPKDTQGVALDSGIEVTFSHADVQNFESAFKIEPAVEGSFEHYGSTWAFVPRQPMAPATLYTVTIDAAVNGPGGAELEEPFSFSFQTEAVDQYLYMIYGQNEVADTFLVDECPIAAMAYDGFEVEKASATVYRLDDSDAFIDAYKKYVRSGAVSGGIMELGANPVAEFKVTPILVDDYNGKGKTAFIHYPEALAQGYYFAELTLENRKVYQLFQSTNLAVYTVSANGAYTAWVNDAITGNAVDDAVIHLDGKKKTQTNEYGFASFTGPSREDEIRFLTIENGEFPYIIAVNGEAPDKDCSALGKYYTYITTNSSLYKTTDTVGVFGMVLPRKSNADIPDEVALKCGFTEEVTVEVDSSGAFSADLSIDYTALSNDNIFLLIDGVEMDSAGITIADYNTPSYNISVTTDRNAYAVGETVMASATVTYPDGTPASGVTVSGDISGVTDQNGYITKEIPVNVEAGEIAYGTNAPYIQTVSCKIEEGAGYAITGTAQYAVLNGSYYLNATYKDDFLSVNVNSFNRMYFEDISVDELHTKLYTEKEYIGPSVDINVSAEVHRITYSKEHKGVSYDPIQKELYDIWNYTELDEIVENVELESSNGIIKWKHNHSTEDERYYVILKATDGGNESTVRCELYDERRMLDSFGAGIYYVEAEHQTVDIGENVRLAVCDSDDGTATSGGSVFYTVVAGEMLDHYYGATSEMEITFKKEYAPEISVYGAYFDGEHIYDLGAEEIFYETENSELRIEFESDKLQYESGDELNANLKVTDRNGKPVSAVLYVSILDRSLYLLNNNATDPSYALLNRRGYTDVYVTTSYRHFETEYLPHIEGKEGSGNNRGNFESSPYWEMIKTNRKGEATVTFTLPDSVTEWKAVFKAFTKDTESACAVYDIAFNEDYVTTVVIGDQLKTADDCTVALKSDGRGLAPDSVCEYTVGLTDQEGNEIETKTATALRSQYVYLNFGPLDEGIYTVYVQSINGVYQDSVIHSFQVAKDRHAIRMNQTVDLQASASLKLTPVQGSVLLTIYDKENASWQKMMKYLAANGGSRVDQALGAYLAENYYTTGTWMDPKKLDLSLLQPYYTGSGLKLFADSGYDHLGTAAKFAAAFPEGCRREELISQFQFHLNDRRASRLDVLMAYFGMAALGEPVMADLQAIYDSATDLSLEEAVYMALAFAYGGDYDTANYLYEYRIKMAFKATEEMAYIEQEDVVDDELTGSVSMLANRLSLDVAEPLINYILEHDLDSTLIGFDLISYLNNYALNLDGKNTVTLKTADGDAKTYQYARTSVLNVSLTKDQAAELQISPIEGSNEVTISFMGDLNGISDEEEVIISGVESEETLKCGAETTIVIPVSFPDGFKGASASVVLPSGLRLTNGRIHYGTYGNDISTGYQKDQITFSLSPNVKYIMLTVRGSIPGNYVIEPLVITNAENRQLMLTDPLQITVTE